MNRGHEKKSFDWFLSSSKLDLRYTNPLHGIFYIEYWINKDTTYDNNPVIFIVLSLFLENSNSW